MIFDFLYYNICYTLKMKITKDKILKKLTEVLDPEIGISIVDLGLIYDVHFRSDQPIVISMTLTTMGCPLFPVIEQDIKNKMADLDLKNNDYQIKLTFDPPWSMDKMSKKAKATLGIQ